MKLVENAVPSQSGKVWTLDSYAEMAAVVPSEDGVIGMVVGDPRSWVWSTTAYEASGVGWVPLPPSDGSIGQKLNIDPVTGKATFATDLLPNAVTPPVDFSAALATFLDETVTGGTLGPNGFLHTISWARLQTSGSDRYIQWTVTTTDSAGTDTVATFRTTITTTTASPLTDIVRVEAHVLNLASASSQLISAAVIKDTIDSTGAPTTAATVWTFTMPDPAVNTANDWRFRLAVETLDNVLAPASVPLGSVDGVLIERQYQA